MLLGYNILHHHVILSSKKLDLLFSPVPIPDQTLTCADVMLQ